MVKIVLVQLHGGACVLICIYMYNILFHLGFTVRQDYFTVNRLVGRKREIPARRAWLVSYVTRARLEPTAVR